MSQAFLLLHHWTNFTTKPALMVYRKFKWFLEKSTKVPIHPEDYPEYFQYMLAKLGVNTSEIVLKLIRFISIIITRETISSEKLHTVTHSLSEVGSDDMKIENGCLPVQAGEVFVELIAKPASTTRRLLF